MYTKFIVRKNYQLLLCLKVSLISHDYLFIHLKKYLDEKIVKLTLIHTYETFKRKIYKICNGNGSIVKHQKNNSRVEYAMQYLQNIFLIYQEKDILSHSEGTDFLSPLSFNYTAAAILPVFLPQ